MLSFHKISDVSTFKFFFGFVAVRSFTANSGLLQPTESVNTTPSHVEFSQCCALIHMHIVGSSLSPHSFHVIPSSWFMRIVVCLSD